MTFAVTLARCTYCGHDWRACIEQQEDGAHALTGLECPRCWGPRGEAKVLLGIEETEEAAGA